MSKGCSTNHNVIKLFGIKIVEHINHYCWKQCNVEDEETRDDITLHERISENIHRKKEE